MWPSPLSNRPRADPPRITEWSGLEGDHRDHLVPIPIITGSCMAVYRHYVSPAWAPSDMQNMHKQHESS